MSAGRSFQTHGADDDMRLFLKFQVYAYDCGLF